MKDIYGDLAASSMRLLRSNVFQRFHLWLPSFGVFDARRAPINIKGAKFVEVGYVKSPINFDHTIIC